MNKKNFIFLAVIIILAIGVMIAVYFSKPRLAAPFIVGKQAIEKLPKIDSPENPVSNQADIIEAEFSCPSGQNIGAAFFNGPDSRVELSLSDGRKMILPQVISASGARYANDDSFVFWNKGDGAFIEENGQITFADCLVQENNGSEKNNETKVGLANPASVNCQDKGGSLSIKTRPDGGQYGLCYFDDGRACEEWSMFRGDCPVGGVKTTGYDTEAQRFCAWSGGRTQAEINAVCVFNNGSSCLAEDFYQGNCHKKD